MASRSTLQTSLRRLAVLSALVAIAGCGDSSTGPKEEAEAQGLPDLGLENVATENEAAREALIPPEGGTLSVTGSNGVVYTLTIPEGALLEETVIGMYPAADIATKPGTRMPAAAVHFVPEGLQLQVGAILKIAFPAGTDLRALVGVTYERDGEDLFLNASRLERGRVVTMPIFHFSGAFMVTGEEVLAALGLDETPSALFFLNLISSTGYQLRQQGLTDDDPQFTARILAIYVRWYGTVVRPALLEGARASLATIEVARQEYEPWRQVASMAGVNDELAPQFAESRELAADYLRNRYRVYNQACEDDPRGSVSAPNGPIAMAAKALAVRTLAQAWGVPTTRANELDVEFLLDNLCVKVGFGDFETTDLERAGDSGSLIVRPFFRIGDGPARRDLPMRVRISRGGGAFGSPSNGRVEGDGSFTTNITWPAGVTQLQIDVIANIDRFGGGIRRFDRVTLEARTDLTGIWTGTFTHDEIIEGEIEFIEGGVSMNLRQQETAIAGTITLLAKGASRSFDVIGELDGADAIEFRATGGDPGCESFFLQGTGTIVDEGQRIVVQYNGSASGSECEATVQSGSLTVFRD